MFQNFYYLKYLQLSLRSHASKHELESSINSNIPITFPSAIGHISGALRRRLDLPSAKIGPRITISNVEEIIAKGMYVFDSLIFMIHQ